MLELLVFFPAEENLYRLKPSKRFELKHTPSATSDEHTNGLSNGHTTTTSKADLVAEPLPPPWTMAKFWWASSLWWSWRGIGWNYTCSLPTTSRSHPFSHSSSRLAYIRRRLTFYILGWFLHDLTRSFMNVGPYSSFFGGHQGAPNYNDLSVGQKALFSICVVTRIVTGMEESSVACGLIFVSIGGVMGWEGEFWSPWGWPPIYGSLADLWRHPGLSSMWSRVSIVPLGAGACWKLRRAHFISFVIKADSVISDMASVLQAVAVYSRMDRHRREDPPTSSYRSTGSLASTRQLGR